MPDVSANGNPIATLSPGRIGAVVQGNRVTGSVSWRHVDPFTLANFRLIEAGELRVFEDGVPVELG